MKFHAIKTAYSVAKSMDLLPEKDTATWRRFYSGLSNMAISIKPVKGDVQRDTRQAIEYSRFRCEYDYMELGEPYFNIWPGVLPMLCDVSIDKIPGKYVKFPFKTFAIRLPAEDNYLAPVMTIILNVETDDIGFDAIEQQRRLTMWMDINETEGDLVGLPPNSGGLANLPALSYSHIRLPDNESIMDVLGRLPDEDNIPGEILPKATIKKCWALIVSVAFLATGTDRIVEPDVLSKDFAAFLEARRQKNEEKVKTIVDRAQRRGKLGWTVGRGEVLRLIPRREAGGGGESHSHELHYQHQRSAHFRCVNEKVIFVRQATVRPDLPPSTANKYGVR